MTILKKWHTSLRTVKLACEIVPWVTAKDATQNIEIKDQREQNEMVPEDF